MRKITIMLVFLLIAGVNFAFAQSRTVTGKITSSQDGMGIPGVTVMIKGTTIGTTTDLDGMYELNVRPEHRTLVLKYVGMKTQEITLGSQTGINVVMEPDVLQMDEVVVTAIGVTRESKALGYAVQTVGSEDLVRSGSVNPINALSGRVAGVQIVNSSGAVGAASYMTIRGNASFTGNNQPLYVVDGVPIDNQQLTAGNPNDGENNLLYGVALSNRIVDINPEDIETMSILKGGAATALYGLRAANGAVIITTKKGSFTDMAKKTTVAFNSSITFEQVSQLPAMQNKWAQGSGGNLRPDGTLNPITGVWGPLMDTLRFDGGDNLYYPDGNVVGQSNPGANQDLKVGPYDNLGNFFQTGVSYNNSVSLTGGNQNTSYYLSIANTSSSGIVPNNTFERTNITISGQTKLNDRFSSDAKISYVNSGGTRIQQGSNTSGVMLALMRMPMNFDITGGSDDPANDEAAYRLPDGRQRNAYNSGGYDNPFWTVNMNQFSDKVDRIIGHTSLNYIANDWMTFTYRIGTDFYSDRRKQFFAIGSRTVPSGRVYEEQHFVREFNSDFMVNINKKINDDFTFLGILGHNMYQTQWQRLFVQGNGLTVPDFFQLSNAASVQAFETQSKKRTAAMYTDLGLSYRNMIYVNGTVRGEWSTSLPDEVNPFMLYSGSGSFIFTELPALKDNNILPFGKFRISYAQIANDAFTYATLPSFGQASYADGWTAGIGFPAWGVSAFGIGTRLPNDKLEPEQLKSFEIGFDLRFLDNRFGLDFSYYDNKSENLILAVPIAKSSGFYEKVMNAGDMVNKGIEVTILATPVKTPDFKWDIDVNFTQNKNEVLKLAKGIDNVFLSGFVGSQSRAVVGQSYGSIFGGYFETNDAGQMLINDDPNSPGYGYPIYAADEKNLGDVLPKWTMGINNALSYKELTFSFLFDIKNGGYMWNGTRGAMSHFGTHANTEVRNDGEVYVFDGVKASNGGANDIKVARNQAWFQGEGGGFFGPASQFVEKTDWVRLREVSLSYKLNKNIVSKTFFHSAEVYVSGRNLWVSTPYTGIDPETSLIGAGNGQGLDYFNMPGTKSYTVGLRLTL